LQTKILYITYDGLSDPVGQSQILPYIIKLSGENYKFHIISAEKKENYNTKYKHIFQLLKKNNITWTSITYHKNPPILSTFFDILTTNKVANNLMKKEGFDIIHCRSYISAFTGMKLKKKYKEKLIFDMRGFYADERIDGNLWNTKNFIYSFIYKFFKKKEALFLNNADVTISLTHVGKDILLDKQYFPKINPSIEVIPCCADLDHFSPAQIDKTLARFFKQKLNIKSTDFVLTYLGSIGTWYMLDEMLLFFKKLLEFKKKAKFLFITLFEKELILKRAFELKIPLEKIIIQGSNRNELPSLLSLSTISIFFIKPVFSKKASSPIKMAELLGMGIPIIANAGIGDVDLVIKESNCGIIVNDFTDKDFEHGISQIDEILNIPESSLQNTAKIYFSLQNGVEKYASVYKQLMKYGS